MGIDAARRGDKPAAQVLLRQVVAADPRNELAWMWLASAVDSIDERRTCLENALRINPNNTRAREALDRLQPGGETSPRRFRPARQRGTGGTSSGPSTATVLVGVVVAVAIIVALIFAVVSSQQPRILPNNELAVALTQSQTPTTDPDTFTFTPSPFMIIVTADITLPPTFTPTFTPTASATPPPSITPVPLSAFIMLYTSLEAGESSLSLYQAAGDGNGEQEMAQGVRDMVYDPSGQKIAFVRDVTTTDADGNEQTSAELFIAPADNPGAAQQITEFGSTISRPTWAPNGIQLAFVSDFDGDEDIWTITDDGENIIKLTENEAIDRDPTWSPDGTQIVYVSDMTSPGLTRLFSMAADGQNPQQLSNLGGNTYHPRFSPDGRRLTFVNDSGGDGDIYIADAQGQSSLLLTVDDNGAEDRSPAFTPDSNWVGFVSNREDDRFQVYVVNLRGDMRTRLTNSERDDQSLDFRPDLVFRLRQN
ncbi:MAG: hypothetical protein CL610_23960 [Anaerolineaceae bacterium]|nr:hypothetical protein [Anaerolineaceae bacterium]